MNFRWLHLLIYAIVTSHRHREFVNGQLLRHTQRLNGVALRSQTQIVTMFSTCIITLGLVISGCGEYIFTTGI